MPVTVPAPADLLVHLRRARDHADRHYTEPIDLAALAAVAGLSKYHFQRLFRSTYGRSPARYLTERRIERAQDLKAKGVEFIQEPSERTYGVEAVCRDNSGNWMVLVQHRAWSPADFD